MREKPRKAGYLHVRPLTMPRSKLYLRLAAIAVTGMAAAALAVLGMYTLRDVLERFGYTIPPVVFVAACLAILGGIYGGFAKLVLRLTGGNREPG